jgi:hypothetical protein
MPPIPAQFSQLFGMVGNPQVSIINNQPQNGQQPNPNQFAQNINSAVNTLMGNLGIRMLPGPNNILPNQQQTPTTNSFQPPQPQQQQFTFPPQTQSQPLPLPLPQPQQQQQNQLPRAPNVSPLTIDPSNYRALEQLELNINRVNFPP